MYDMKWIRDNPKEFDKQMERRGEDCRAAVLVELDEENRMLKTQIQNILTEKNKLSKEIGKVMKAKGDASTLTQEVNFIKMDLQQMEPDQEKIEAELKQKLLSIPNMPYNDVPDGDNEDDNVEIDQNGDIPTFDFTPLNHWELGENLGMMDFERAAKMSGSRFVILRGQLAKLERALGQFMIDHNISKGYEEISVPTLVLDSALQGTGQLPKFKDDLFKDAEHNKWMIPTAEVPLTNLYANEILNLDELPFRFTALSLCYRAEAGGAGRDTRGMIRQHQFYKAELVTVCGPNDARNEHMIMLNCATSVLCELNLPYRVVELCTGDLGFGAKRTYDVEVWLPGQNTYREISSVSDCGAFQARRMKMRYRVNKGMEFPHTLNGSSLAVGRCLVAILENFQQKDGSVKIPEALQPYMNGLDVIK